MSVEIKTFAVEYLHNIAIYFEFDNEAIPNLAKPPVSIEMPLDSKNLKKQARCLYDSLAAYDIKEVVPLELRNVSPLKGGSLILHKKRKEQDYLQKFIIELISYNPKNQKPPAATSTE